jgi:SanA protein
MKRILRIVSKIIIYGFLFSILSIMGIYIYIYLFSSPYCYNHMADLPENKVGLLLGTAKYVSEGHINKYYLHRIEAAETLYEKGKIQYLLVSGDNALISYNEPRTFKKDLVARGIPSERIYLDYAGFRTFDSIVRASKVFGQQSFTVISQDFQNERAVYIGRAKNIDVIAYNVEHVSILEGWRVLFREMGARVRTLFDVHLLNTSPKFLGEQIVIG